MRYRLTLVLAGSVLLMGAAGPVTCSQQAQDDEARLLALATQIRAGAAVGAQAIQSGFDVLCANGGAVNAGVQNIKSVIAAGGPGPKTSANLAAADKSLAVLNNACNASPGASSSALVSLFREGWAAYLAAKNYSNAANATASNGS